MFQSPMAPPQGAPMGIPPMGPAQPMDPMAALMSAAQQTPQGDAMERDKPEPDPARKANIKLWTDRINRAKKDLDGKQFKRMKEDMQFARKGGDVQWTSDGQRYVANIIQRHVNSRVASLYARNPRAVAKRRRKLDFKLWDGNPQSLMAAIQAVQTGMDMTGHATALLQDVQQAQSNKIMVDKVARTLELLFDYYMDSQEVGFKAQMKQMVRRTVVTCVGYIKLDYQRLLEARPEVSAQIADATNRLNSMRQIAADLADGEMEKDDPAVEQLRIMVQELQAQEYSVVREGLVFDYPRSNEIIIDPKCRQLRGFVGATWIAHEMTMDADQVKQTYQKDIGSNYTAYVPNGKDPAGTVNPHDDKGSSKKLAQVWEVQDKKTGTFFTICDGYPDYLKEPAAPDAVIDRFFTVFSLTFNDVEDEEDIYPASDVSLIRPMQEEYNRSRQGLREHRAANRPKYVTPAGRLEEKDKEALRTGAANILIEMNSLAPGEKIGDLIQGIKMAPIDPAMYDTTPIFEDVQRTVGTQQADLGDTGHVTATESSIAEGSRSTTTSSNVDDLDDLLSDLARSSGQVLLKNMQQATVRRIVGPGAVWPQLSRQDIAEEILLDVRAGSSGRPNKAQELANLERAAPTILQVPGINPVWFARQVLERLDDDLDIDEALLQGVPSMIAMNSQHGNPQPSTGSPHSDPGQQGAKGGNNAPSPQQRPQGPQPAMPAPQQSQPAQQVHP